VFDWRQVAGDEEYPRYRTLLPDFLRHLETFVAVFREHTEERPPIAWCE
jgi:hypothetical protein